MEKKQILATSSEMERYEILKDKYISVAQARENSQLKQVYVLLGAYKKNETIVPVQLEIKESIGTTNQLYLAIAIKKSGVDDTASTEVASVSIPDSFLISIHDLIKKINSDAIAFLKYIPKQFLSLEQLEGKRKGILRDIKKYPNSPFRRITFEIEPFFYHSTINRLKIYTMKIYNLGIK